MRDCDCMEGCRASGWCWRTGAEHIVRTHDGEEREMWVCSHCTMFGDHRLDDEVCYVCYPDFYNDPERDETCKLREKYQ